ncbi:MAG: leucyl aminopeptidase family protein, partial [Patescibacteria group bacterium]|nr:leucyl aminopeptidase family protein [Patescibacteria group bacterium]
IKNNLLIMKVSELMSRKEIILLARKIIVMAKKEQFRTITFRADDFKEMNLTQSDISLGELAKIMAVNFEMANFEFDRYKNKKTFRVRKIIIHGNSALDSSFLKGFSKGRIVGEWTNYARALINEPGSKMTPKAFSRDARKAAIKAGLKCTVKTALAKFGGVTAVGKGSVNTPRFIILEHNGGAKGEKPVVLVGKGVTYDSGGQDLKSAAGMLDMQMDMSGGAAVIAALAIAAKLKLKKNIVGLIPAVENMLSDKSYRPNDIITMLSGKTVEVENTDAEGRIILADALTYAAENYNPQLIVDIATLTGAALYVAGEKYSVYLTNAQKLENIVKMIGKKSGDLMWPLPLEKEYEKELEGRFADLSNMGKSKCGTVTAALFLYQFVKEAKIPWLHIDMAPTMLAYSGDYLAKGSSGAPIRFLVELLEKEMLPLLEVE